MNEPEQFIADRWLIAGKCHAERQRMRDYIGRTCGAINLKLTTKGIPGCFHRKTRWN